MFPHAVYLKDQQAGRTALHFAAFKGQTKIAEILINSSADIQARDADRNTCFHLCS